MRPFWILLACVVILGGCAGSETFAPWNGDETETGHAAFPASPVEIARIDCHVDMKAGTVTCGPPSAPEGTGSGAAPAVVTIGGQHRYARLWNGIPQVGGLNTLNISVSVQNLTLQPWGTSDGSTSDPYGVRVFFVRGPTQDVTPTNYDGIDTFTEGAQWYYEYTGLRLGTNSILAPGDSTRPVPGVKTWTFNVPGGVVTGPEWDFGVLVSTVVPDPSQLTTDMERIARGSNHTCGLSFAGKAFCWGSNAVGELGIGVTAGVRTIPTPVNMPAGVSRFIDIAAGHQFTCAIAEDGTAYCWGSDGAGQLGNGDETGNKNLPFPVSMPVADPPVKFTQISAGNNHVCAVDDQYRAWCWGGVVAGAGRGKLGHGIDSNGRNAPIAVELPAEVEGFTYISAGGSHTCALDTNDNAWCWGDQSSGRLGNNEILGVDVISPTEVVTDAEFIFINAGNGHTCALTEANDAYCWGSNAGSKLGVNSPDAQVAFPTKVVDGENSGGKFVSIAAGTNFTCGIGADHVVYCWGIDQWGALGNGIAEVNSATPAAVNLSFVNSYLNGNTPYFVEVWNENTSVTTAGTNCALTTQYTVFCWGLNGNGQLGDGTSGGAGFRTVPDFVAAIRPVTP